MVGIAQKTQSRKWSTSAETQCRLLLVEEDSDELRHYFGILNALGHRVIVAGSYAHALDLLEHEKVDMVIVGQGSPAFEGRDVLVRALEVNPGTPVVIVARSLDIDCYLESMELGAADYVEKSASPREFMRALDAHLRKAMAA